MSPSPILQIGRIPRTTLPENSSIYSSPEEGNDCILSCSDENDPAACFCMSADGTARHLLPSGKEPLPSKIKIFVLFAGIAFSFSSPFKKIINSIRKSFSHDLEPLDLKPEKVGEQLENYFRGELKILHYSGLLYHYLAEDAINEWNGLSDVQKRKFIRGSYLIYENSLPQKFVEHYTNRLLEADGLLGFINEGHPLRKKVAQWALMKINGSPPDFELIANRLGNLWPLTLDRGDYLYFLPNLARAVADQWSAMSAEAQILFINVEEDDHLDGGVPPERFLEQFVEDQEIHEGSFDNIRKLVQIYASLAKDVDGSNESFREIKQRAATILEVWSSLPPKIRREEFGEHAADKIPEAYMSFMKTPPSDLGGEPAEILKSSSSKWIYNPLAEIFIHSETRLNYVMNLLVGENDELAYYPRLLQLRAESLILSWNNLSAQIKESFWEKDKKIGNEYVRGGIPKIYAALWHATTYGLDSLIRAKDKSGRGGSGPAQCGGGGGDCIIGEYYTPSGSSGNSSMARMAFVESFYSSPLSIINNWLYYDGMSHLTEIQLFPYSGPQFANPALCLRFMYH